MPCLSPLSRALILALPVAALAGQAMAHPGHGLHSGFASGFLHPILGWDHVVAMLAVGLWAVFHGHAHGTEMPEAYGALGYGAGFVIGTVLLHLAGIALGLAARSEVGRIAMRGAGGIIALIGTAFLFGVA